MQIMISEVPGQQAQAMRARTTYALLCIYKTEFRIDKNIFPNLPLRIRMIPMGIWTVCCYSAGIELFPFLFPLLLLMRNVFSLARLQNSTLRHTYSSRKLIRGRSWAPWIIKRSRLFRTKEFHVHVRTVVGRYVIQTMIWAKYFLIT